MKRAHAMWLVAAALPGLLLCTWAEALAQDGGGPPAAAAPRARARYAEIEVGGPILEILPELYLIEPDVETLYDLVGRIEKARRDASVQGVIVKLDRLGTGWAKAEEIRRAILRCRQAGKEVVCFTHGCGNLDYLVASAADRVVMIPSGSLLLVGLRAEVLFLKGLLDKIGVEADMIQIGSAKGAEEPFTRTTGSEAFKRSINELLDDYYRQLVEGIAEGRGLEPEPVRELIESGPFTARRAKDAGLVDELMFYDELVESLRERHGERFVLAEHYGEKGEGPSALGTAPQDLLKMVLGMGAVAPRGGWPAGPTIAVLYAVGPIVSEDPDDILIGESVVNAERLSQILDDLRERDSVKAVVLRVDSPGGSAEASDLIWHELRRLNEAKPVVASLSDVAGSGGYYIATGGRLIFAEEGTVTGSIGVIGGKFVLKGLFEKLGLGVDVYERGAHAGLFSPVEAFSDSQRERLRELLLETHEIFIDRVATSRDQPPGQVRRWAEGQSLTGRQARDGKLVDAIGGLYDAIEAARAAAKLPEGAKFSVVRLPRPQSVLDALFWGRRDVRLPTALLRQTLPAEALPAVRYLSALRCVEDNRPAALMPALITVR